MSSFASRTAAAGVFLAAALAGCTDLGQAPPNNPDGNGGDPPAPVSVVLEAVADATLYDHACGCIANGAGRYLHAGTRMGDQAIRRSLLRFDIAGALPAGATVESARLALQCSIVRDDTAHPFTLHRVLTPWTEGTSVSDLPGGGPGSGGGGGAAATPGDPTWTHSIYDSALWTTPGGDFAPGAAATRSVSAIGPYEWTSQELAADVQAWLDNPGVNRGWILLGEESVDGSAKRFDSRESPLDTARPRLAVVYTPAP